MAPSSTTTVDSTSTGLSFPKPVFEEHSRRKESEAGSHSRSSHRVLCVPIPERADEVEQAESHEDEGGGHDPQGVSSAPHQVRVNATGPVHERLAK